MLYHVLRQQNGLGLLPPQTQKTLRARWGQEASANLLALAEARAWAQRFAAADIPALWLKGVPLSLTVYPHPILRPMMDIDVLVPRTQIDAALRLVEATTGKRAVSLDRDVDRHAVVQGGSAVHARLEIHWSLVDLPIGSVPVLNGDRRSLAGVTEDVTWFFNHQQSLFIEGSDLSVLQPEAHLLYLCAHAEILHGESSFRLLRYFDLHRLITQTTSFDWQVVVDGAVACGWTYAVERALSITRHFFATPLPAGLLVELQERRPAGEDVVRVTRWQGPDDRGTRLLARVAGMSWPVRLHYLVGYAFPPPAYMRQRYGIQRGWQTPGRVEAAKSPGRSLCRNRGVRHGP
jgi:hypothetical protein